MDEDKNIYWHYDEVFTPGYYREMMRPTLIAECEAQERDNTRAWAASIKPDTPYPFANNSFVSIFNPPRITRMKTVQIGKPPKAAPNRAPIRVQIPQSLYDDLLTDKTVYPVEELTQFLVVALGKTPAEIKPAPGTVLLEIHAGQDFMTDLMAIQGIPAVYELASIIRNEIVKPIEER